MSRKYQEIANRIDQIEELRPDGETRTMDWRKYNPPPEAAAILSACPSLVIASSTTDLVDLACGGPDSNYFEVVYEIPGKGRVVEAT
ncbi:MAG: hypothetical protein NZ765_13130, partial [Anaerolineae bacterium]|nr:hypothetical protein [Anaerolineae bacterium]MDW8072526.1 hypothetical protein [Anaerolineae bacterium]